MANNMDNKNEKTGQFCTLYNDNYDVCYGCGEMLGHSNVMNNLMIYYK